MAREVATEHSFSLTTNSRDSEDQLLAILCCWKPYNTHVPQFTTSLVWLVAKDCARLLEQHLQQQSGRFHHSADIFALNCC